MEVWFDSSSKKVGSNTSLIRTTFYQTRTEPNFQMSNSSRTEHQGSNLLNKNPFPRVKNESNFLPTKNLPQKFFFAEKTYNISFFWQYFCQKKFTNILSNFELLQTSNLRYKNANFRTRTKFECISK